MTPFDVLVVGELNVDLILNKIDQFPVMGKEVLADAMTLTLGSSSAIFASNLSTLGSRVTFSGKVGKDDFGNYVLSFLKRKGVDVSNVLSSHETSTGATIVLNYGEDRAMVTHPGAMAEFTINDIPDVLFQESRHLHVSSIFLQPSLKNDILELFRKAKSSGMTTSLDPQWDPAEKWDIDFESLLPCVDVFMPNLKELECITGIQDPLTAMKSLSSPNIVAVKNGRAGAWLLKGDELLSQPSFINRNVVDSIGAGDSFDAGFIHKFIQQRSLKECLEFAALTGAVNTTRAGGTTAFEDIHTVRKIAHSSFNYNF
ncbi:MAG TPA: carbohydrate kinase family protein [Cyclobacteriaceae bacterium]|nr:carbohydrate kinase family protein [Cyclobacteriaceae bacterium]